MRRAWFVFVVAVLLCGINQNAICAHKDSKIATRIDRVTVEAKHRKLTIHVSGMGTTPSWMGRAGQLVRRNPGQPNKEGLLEYELVFMPPREYSGFTLKTVKASLKESSVAAGVKGVRVHAEFNHMDALIPEPQPKKKREFHLFGKKRTEQAQ